MHRIITRSALAAAVLATFNVYADDMPTVVVTATRFSETSLKTAANITVITAEDIRNTPAVNLPDVLKGVAGIEVRQLSGSMGIDATVDMRGFGDTAGSNTLILIDGQRLNPVDSGPVSWSTIPLDSIQRIEIIRGNGTVLFGDQAVGGVVNIITDKSGTPKASATATIGSYGYRGGDVQAAGGNGAAYFNTFVHYADNDGWRQNNQMDQQAVSGRGGLKLSAGEAFVDYSFYKDANGLPGALPTAAYRSDPRSSITPDDTQHRDGYRLRPGISYAISDTLSFEAELSAASEKYHADDVSYAGTFDRTRDIWSLTPRLRWRHGLGGLNSETVIGMDYYNAHVKGKIDGTAFVNAEPEGAEQKSTALYAQNSTELGGNWLASMGARSQRMDQRANEGAYVTDFGFGPFATPAFEGESTRTRNAYDFGLVYQTDGWRAYAKTGTTFRFANTDDLFGFDPNTGNPVFAGDLKPEHGTVNEIGASFTGGVLHGSASLYRLNLRDEIGFDEVSEANVNFAPTKRTGLETELDWRVAASLKARFSYTYLDARFREGPYAGNELPLVARDKASAGLTWQGGGVGTYSVVADYVGDRRYSGDFANSLNMLSGYVTMDLQGSWDLKPWTITAKLLNALDRRYAPYALYSTFHSDYYYYPADARSLFVSARYQFQ